MPSSMCTEARPVRVEAIALRKSSTAFSMRVFSCTYVSFSPAMLAIVACAIRGPLPNSAESNVKL